MTAGIPAGGHGILGRVSVLSWSFLFFANSILLGVGLAMDAFSISVANSLTEPNMRPGRMCRVAGVFGGFQFLMPMVGWVCVRTVAQAFTAFQKFIPWIALALLVYIGGKMLYEGLHDREEEAPPAGVSWGALLVQGVATSIDALSVGFTIAEYPLAMALTSALLIGAVTFAVCMGGLRLGKKAGEHLAGRASILGGLILIAIGLEIFLKGILA